MKRVAVSGTMPLILIWGSRGRGIGSISERFTFSLSASRACRRSVCKNTIPQRCRLRRYPHNGKNDCSKNSNLTFFLRFPLSLCTAFIRCTSLSTNVCCAANRDRITLTLLSPWSEEEALVLEREVQFSLKQQYYDQRSLWSIVFTNGPNHPPYLLQSHKVNDLKTYYWTLMINFIVKWQ